MYYCGYLPITVAARSKAWFCGRSFAGIARSNPAGGMDVYREYRVLSSRGLSVGLITRPEESYTVCCVWVWSWSSVRGDHDRESGRSATGKNVCIYIYIYIYIFIYLFICIVWFKSIVTTVRGKALLQLRSAWEETGYKCDTCHAKTERYLKLQFWFVRKLNYVLLLFSLKIVKLLVGQRP